MCSCVAFVTPIYITDKNGLNFFEETIKGFLKQTDNNWKAILIEDCSTNSNVRKLIKQYQNIDNRIHSIFLDKRISTGLCRNLGINWAKDNNCEVILYNDADDISDINRVKITKEIFAQNKDIDVVYSGFRVIME